jgi:hypothetical protein
MVEGRTPEESVDKWLTEIDRVGRELTDPVSGLDALDAMAARYTRPTIGWMQRNTRALAR